MIQNLFPKKEKKKEKERKKIQLDDSLRV